MPKYKYEDFIEIIRRLRAKDGCPWDREQTHESLKPCIAEESAELQAAIRIWKETGNAENMQEELGDILLQVVMHSQIASEEGLFSMEDVVEEVSEKMVRRHPHVFGDVSVTSSDQVLTNWDEIKKKEKEGKTWIASPLQEIPRELPALARAPKIWKKINSVYEKQPDAEKRLTLAREQIGQLNLAEEKDDFSKQLGEIFYTLCSLAAEKKVYPDFALEEKIREVMEKYEPKRTEVE